MRTSLLFLILISTGAFAETTPDTPQSDLNTLSGEAPRENIIRRAKLFMQYSKGALVFSAAGNNADRALNIYPATKPSLGLAIELSKYLAISYARSADGLGFNQDKDMTTKYQHFEAHLTQANFVVDLHALQYRGLYALSQPRRDARPFQDSVFIGNRGAVAYPNLEMKSAGLGVTLNIDNDGIDVSALMNQKRRIDGTSWGRIVMLQLRNSEFSNDVLINQDSRRYNPAPLEGLPSGQGLLDN